MDNAVLPKTWEKVLNAVDFMPVVINSIERHFDAGWSQAESKHEFYEMVYVKKGFGIFKIDKKTVSVGPNDIVIIKPGKTHVFKISAEGDCEFIVLYFSFASLKSKYKGQGTYSEISLDEFINFVSESYSGAFLKLKVNQKNEIITLLNKIMKERFSTELGSEFLVYLLIMELFVMISRALKAEWERSIKDESPKLKELIDIAIGYIKNNFERDISLQDISKHVFLSQSYFARTFKKITGKSPINFLLSVRIERAKEMLKETNNKVGDIALSVGFSNQQRFNEIFKKLTGMTPLSYRKKTQIDKI